MTVTNIALEREEKRESEREKKKSYHNKGYSYLATHSSINPAVQIFSFVDRRRRHWISPISPRKKRTIK